MKRARERRGAKPSVKGNSSEKRSRYRTGKRGRRDVLNGRRAERAKCGGREKTCDGARSYILI